MNQHKIEESEQGLSLEIRRRAMDLLARREHSYKELLQKLQQRDYLQGDIEPVLSVLVTDGLLSDNRFAEAYIYMRRKKGYGPIRIQADLREKGVSPEIVQQLLDDDFDWYALARGAYLKRFGTELPADMKEKQRRMRFMQQRGFSSEHVRACLDEHLFTD